MAIRTRWRVLLAGLLALAACGEPERGPILVSAIGDPPELVNPNLERLDPPSAFLIEATAQGLVHFDALGQIEPALAQSWIVSDDGLRYTFRLQRAEWTGGGQVTAEQVAQRLRAASSRASSNALKPILGAIEEIEAMTEEVLEIRLVAPRPNFLQVLAQPEMAIIRNGAGTGPYRAEPAEGDALLLTPLKNEDEAEEEDGDDGSSNLVLRGEPAAMAIARFSSGGADLVVGGTAGTLPLVRAADLPAAALRFDPAVGLFGLAFASDREAVADPAVRRALSMAIDRAALVESIAVPNLQPRDSIVPAGGPEFVATIMPDWSATDLATRRQLAAASVAEAADEEPITLRVALPDEPGYRLLFAHLRRDWRLIGVEAERVDPGEPADLRLLDLVAPANLGSWYLRQFSCDGPLLCSAEADGALVAARTAPTLQERQAQLAVAERLMTDATLFIPLAAPVRWSLVSPRLTGFQPNPFARHFAGRLVEQAP